MNCPICAKSFSSTRVFHFPTYNVHTCNHCLTRFCQPFIDNTNIYGARFVKDRAEYFGTEHLSFAHAKELIPYLTVKNKSVLDIGCGNGAFLNSIKENNQVMGLELSKYFEPFLFEKGIPHRIGDTAANLKSLPDASFDIISFWDVFEHLEDPVGILKLVKPKLTADGVVINWTNNYDDWISRFAEMTYRGTFGKVRMFMKKSFNRPGGHNYNFAPKSLEILYRDLGFKIVDTLITDTPSYRLTRSVPFRIILEIFYLLNSISKKGKIICHILKIEDMKNHP